MKKYDVIIVGAGIAGMVSALKLQKLGLRTLIIEAKKGVGGRTYSLYHKESEEYIDNGQHLLVGAYHSFFRFLKEIDSLKYLDFKKGISIDYYDFHKSKFTLNTESFKNKLGLIFGFINFKALSLFQLYEVFKFFYNIQFRKLSTTGFNNVSELLHSQNQDTIIIKYVWEPICIAVMNLSIYEASPEVFLNVLKRLFFGEYSDSSIVYPKVPLSRLFDNYEETYIQNGGEIKFGKRIDSVNFENSRISSIQSSETLFYADNYIFSIPPNHIKKIQGLEKEVIEFDYSEIISGYLWYDFEVNLNEITGLIGTNLQWIFNRRKININRNNKYPGHIAITISDANKLKDLNLKEIEGKILDESRNIFPNLNLHKPSLIKIIRDKYATPKITPQSIGQRRNKSLNYKNLLYIGDWTFRELPATIEAASISGEEIIHQIIN